MASGRAAIIVAVALFGCGGGGSLPADGGASGTGGANPPQMDQACTSLCTHHAACFVTGGMTDTTCLSACDSAVGSTGTCINQSQIVGAITGCAAVTDCTALAACETGIPTCQPPGGSTDAGGTTGGDAGDLTSCDPCAQAADCCTALGQPASECTNAYLTLCQSEPEPARPTFVQSCVEFLQKEAQAAAAPAACR
jgi:hypothetical protein